MTGSESDGFGLSKARRRSSTPNIDNAMNLTFEVRVAQDVTLGPYSVSAGVYQRHAALNFNGPGNYWLYPQATCVGAAWSGVGFDLGICANEADAKAAAAACIAKYFRNGTDDAIWALDAEIGLA